MSRASRTSGVFPTRSRIESATSIAWATCPSAVACRVDATRARPPHSALAPRRGRPARARPPTPAPSPHAAASSAGSACRSTAAACTHAPVATSSGASGTTTGRPLRSARNCAVRARAAAAADEEQTAVGGDARRGERVEAVEQTAHDPFERGARQLFARDVGAQSGDRCPSRAGGPARARRRSTARARAHRSPGGAASASASSRRGRRRAGARSRRSPSSRSACTRAGGSGPVASANPATAPEASAVGVSLTAKTVPDVPIDTTTSPAPQPDAERGRHVVAGPGGDHRGPSELLRGARRGRAGRAPSGAAPSSRCRDRRSRADPRGNDSRAALKYPVPDASPRSVTNSPESR